MEVLLGFGGFDVDIGVEMTMIQVYIDFQTHDLEGVSLPIEFDKIVAIKAFKKLD